MERIIKKLKARIESYGLYVDYKMNKPIQLPFD